MDGLIILNLSIQLLLIQQSLRLRSNGKRQLTSCKNHLASVSEEHLATECPLKSPIGDFTFGGTIAFLAQHESYDIGQIGFLKKYFTKEGMKY